MMLTRLIAAALLSGALAHGAELRAPGVIHFEDGRTLRFDDLLKFRFGPHPGQILLEPRGVYVQSGTALVQIPADQLREIRVAEFRLARAEGCIRPCGIAGVTLTVVTNGGVTITTNVGFADTFLVITRNDGWSDSSERSVSWATVGRDGTVKLNVRRITFTSQ